MRSFEVLEIPTDQGGPRLARLFNAQRDETQLTALRRGGTVLMAVLPAPLAGSLVLGGGALLETARIVAGVWICVALGSLFLVAAELRSRWRVASLLRQLGARRTSSRARPAQSGEGGTAAPGGYTCNDGAIFGADRRR